jgi:hypothetical protein
MPDHAHTARAKTMVNMRKNVIMINRPRMKSRMDMAAYFRRVILSTFSYICSPEWEIAGYQLYGILPIPIKHPIHSGLDGKGDLSP